MIERNIKTAPFRACGRAFAQSWRTSARVRNLGVRMRFAQTWRARPHSWRARALYAILACASAVLACACAVRILGAHPPCAFLACASAILACACAVRNLGARARTRDAACASGHTRLNALTAILFGFFLIPVYIFEENTNSDLVLTESKTVKLWKLCIILGHGGL